MFTQSLAAAVPQVDVLEGDIEDFGPNYLVSMMVLALLMLLYAGASRRTDATSGSNVAAPPGGDSISRW